jgi:hypothetical protein
MSGITVNYVTIHPANLSRLDKNWGAEFFLIEVLPVVLFGNLHRDRVFVKLELVPVNQSHAKTEFLGWSRA